MREYQSLLLFEADKRAQLEKTKKEQDLQNDKMAVTMLFGEENHPNGRKIKSKDETNKKLMEYLVSEREKQSSQRDFFIEKNVKLKN